MIILRLFSSKQLDHHIPLFSKTLSFINSIVFVRLCFTNSIVLNNLIITYHFLVLNILTIIDHFDSDYMLNATIAFTRGTDTFIKVTYINKKHNLCFKFTSDIQTQYLKMNTMVFMQFCWILKKKCSFVGYVYPHPINQCNVIFSY